MKKLLTVLFVLLMCLSLGACSKQEPAEEPSIGMPNPMVEYNSLEEINEKVGVKLVKPGVMGVADEKFFVISDTIAQYDFNVNGISYTARASKDTAEDISGIYVDGKTIFEGSDMISDYYVDDSLKACRLVTDDGQYIYVANDEGKLDEETFGDICLEMINTSLLSLSDPVVNELVGTYQDSTSQRANALVDIIGKDLLLIDIEWADSADAYDEWVIQAKYNNGKLEYEMNGIAHLHITVDENGEVTDAVQVNDAIGGYFEVIDGTICWTGSGVANTAECVFEKVN